MCTEPSEVMLANNDVMEQTIRLSQSPPTIHSFIGQIQQPSPTFSTAVCKLENTTPSPSPPVISRKRNRRSGKRANTPESSNEPAPPDRVRCPDCDAFVASNVRSYMEHLVAFHPVPLVWPSSQYQMLTDEDECRTPYTTIVESRKKRINNTPPRPLNSYMLFGQHIRRKTLMIFRGALNQAVSKTIGNLWNCISSHIRHEYSKEAGRLGSLHAIEFPDYKYRPKKRHRPPPPPRLDTPATDNDVFPASLSISSSSSTTISPVIIDSPSNDQHLIDYTGMTGTNSTCATNSSDSAYTSEHTDSGTSSPPAPTTPTNTSTMIPPTSLYYYYHQQSQYSSSSSTTGSFHVPVKLKRLAVIDDEQKPRIKIESDDSMDSKRRDQLLYQNRSEQHKRFTIDHFAGKQKPFVIQPTVQDVEVMMPPTTNSSFHLLPIKDNVLLVDSPPSRQLFLCDGGEDLLGCSNSFNAEHKRLDMLDDSDLDIDVDAVWEELKFNESPSL